MRKGSRRKLDVGLLGAGAVVLAGAGGVAAFAANGERVTAFWAGAELRDGGSAAITEVIDYDFGAFSHHGIYRDVPDLSPEATVTADSLTAPDDVLVTDAPPDSPDPGATRIRIGDPDTTVSGNHRYQVQYELDTLTPNGSLAWDAVGTTWTVPIQDVEVNVVAPWTFTNPECFHGQPDSGGADSDSGDSHSGEQCDVDQPEPGHLVAHVDEVDTGEGVTVYAGRGAALPAAPALAVPPLDGGTTDDPLSPGVPAVLAGGTALLAAAPTSRLLRRAGRERVGAGGPADAAFAGAGARPVAERRVDDAELDQMATIEFAPPDGLTPAQGGVVLTEGVRPEHKVAWLITEAIDGSIAIDDEAAAGRKAKQVTLRRLSFGTPQSAPLLDRIFRGQDELELGKYDKGFAAAWSAVGASLQSWADASGFWDRRANRRTVLARVLGGLGLLLGLGIVVLSAVLTTRSGAPWLAGVALGGLLAGGSVAALVRAWELKVRTPQGTAAWLRVESFRRFLAASEAYHAEQAAARGVLREYTAWAVAVGEIDRWTHAMESATDIPDRSALTYAVIAPHLVSATHTASTAPSSSGGGGGGGVGGGGGGGGGGSW